MARNRGIRRATRICQRRDQVARLYLTGQTQLSIARALRVSQGTVSSDLAELRSMWVSEAKLNIAELTARELAKIDRVEAEAWEGWRRSQDSKETTTAGTEGGKDHTSIRRETSAGDGAFLQIILRAIERRCALLGLDAATKTQFVLGGDAVEQRGISLTPADLQAVEALIAEASQIAESGPALEAVEGVHVLPAVSTNGVG